MATFSASQHVEKNFDETPVSTLTYMKKLSQALQVQALGEENEVLKTKILGQHMAAVEAAESAPDWDKVAQLRSTEKEREIREMNEIFAGLTTKINTLCSLYNKDKFKFNEMANRLRTLGDDYESCLRRLLEKLKALNEKEKLARKECDKLKEKEETYKAHEKELNDKICQLERENKEKTDKIAEILNEKYFNDLTKSKYDLIKRSSSNVGDDDISSFTSCCNESFEVQAQKTFKYCGAHSSYSMNKALAYRHLRKTRTSIAFTDSESLKDEKRSKKIQK